MFRVLGILMHCFWPSTYSKFLGEFTTTHTLWKGNCFVLITVDSGSSLTLSPRCRLTVGIYLLLMLQITELLFLTLTGSLLYSANTVTVINLLINHARISAYKYNCYICSAKISKRQVSLLRGRKLTLIQIIISC